MLTVVSANLNGIRAAARKGFFDWLQKEQPEIVCIQETKAQLWQLDDAVFHPEGYQRFFFDAEKKGYSGVALYTRIPPCSVETGLGWAHADTEGRFILARYPHAAVASLYLPSGSSSEERHQGKLDFMQRFECWLQQWHQNETLPVIVCGDWNTVHREIDIKNFKANQKNSGCTDEERQWMETLLSSGAWVDAFRVVNQEKEQYTWWSNRGQARAKNVGWRIDYQMISAQLKSCVKSASIYREEQFSDHAPLSITYDFSLV